MDVDVEVEVEVDVDMDMDMVIDMMCIVEDEWAMRVRRMGMTMW